MDFHSCNDGVIEIRFIFIYHLKQLKMNKILETVRLSQKYITAVYKRLTTRPWRIVISERQETNGMNTMTSPAYLLERNLRPQHWEGKPRWSSVNSVVSRHSWAFRETKAARVAGHGTERKELHRKRTLETFRVSPLSIQLSTDQCTCV